MTEWVVPATEAGARVDRFVAARLGISRHAVWRLLERGAVRVGGKRARKGQRVAPGDRVSLSEGLSCAGFAGDRYELNIHVSAIRKALDQAGAS